MWQITWMFSFLPDWFWTLLLICGIVAFLAARFFPQFPLKIGGITAIIISVWFLGAASNEAKWEAKVKEVEAKVAAAEIKSQQATVKIVTKTVKQLELVRTRGDDIINYVDREVVKDREVIKFVENCPIPSIIVNTHNAAALNQPFELRMTPGLEEKK